MLAVAKTRKFCIFASGGHNYSEKMTEIVLTGFLMIFRMLLAACLCDVQEPS